MMISFSRDQYLKRLTQPSLFSFFPKVVSQNDRLLDLKVVCFAIERCCGWKIVVSMCKTNMILNNLGR